MLCIKCDKDEYDKILTHANHVDEELTLLRCIERVGSHLRHGIEYVAFLHKESFSEYDFYFACYKLSDCELAEYYNCDTKKNEIELRPCMYKECFLNGGINYHKGHGWSINT